MKLLYITNYPVQYRIDFYAELYKQLGGKKNIHFIFIPDSTKRESISDYHSEFECASFYLKGTGFASAYVILKEFITFRPDFVIVGGLNFNTLLCEFFSSVSKMQTVIWWGGLPHTDKKNWKTSIRHFIARHCTIGMFYSKDTERFFLSFAPQIKHRFILGNNTRDVEKLRSGLVGIPPLYSDNLQHIISIGFQERRKNTIVLLKAAKILMERGLKDFRIDIVGTGELIEEITTYAEKNNLPVFFHGKKSPEDSLKLLSQSTLFVHPSLIDSWPQVYTEAMCCGIPALLSNTSGVNNSYVDKLHDSILFSPNDENELADKIEHALTDHEFYQTMAQTQLQTAYETTASKLAQHLLEFLDNTKQT